MKNYVKRSGFKTMFVVLAATLTAVGAASACSAAKPRTEILSTQTVASVTPAKALNDDKHIFSKGAYSVQLEITNDTGQNITLVPDETSVLGSWEQKPQQTLDDGEGEFVDVYSDNPIGSQVTVTYQLPDGEYAASSGSTMLDAFIIQTISGAQIGTGWSSSDDWIKTQDPNDNSTSANSGGAHIWAESVLQYKSGQ